MKKQPIFIINLLCTRAVRILFIIYSLAIACSESRAQVRVWGNGQYGQTNVPASVTNVVALAGGDSHCLALRADGTVVAWGSNTVGQLNTPSDLTNAVSIAAGSTHSLALRSDGTIAMWGRTRGDGISNAPPEATNVVALAKGPAEHALVLKGDGTLLDWGFNSYGLTNIPGAATNVVSVAAGGMHALALRADGNVVAWGYNGFGQTTVPESATNVVAIAAGSFDSMALRADGTVVVWGGDPIDPPGVSPWEATNVVDIACGYGQFMALRRDGTLVVWGYSRYGEGLKPSWATNLSGIAAATWDSMALIGSSPSSQVVLSEPRMDAQGFHLSLPSQSGRVYRLEYKDSFVDSVWTSLPLVAGNGSTLRLSDPAPVALQRFYRVRRW